MKQENEDIKAREKLIVEEGINRLKSTLKEQDFQKFQIVHGLLEGARAIKSNLDNSQVEPLHKKSVKLLL